MESEFNELLTRFEGSHPSDWVRKLHAAFQLPHDANPDFLKEILLTRESSASSSSLSSDSPFTSQQSDEGILDLREDVFDEEEEEGEKKGEGVSHLSFDSSTTIEEERKKRRRIYRRSHYLCKHPFSRIPSTDIRRQFPTIWMNVFHQCSPPLYASFIRYYGHKQLVYGTTGWNPGKDGHITTYLPHIRTEYKTEKYLESYLHRCAMSVDMTYELRGCEIRRSRVSKGTEVALNLLNTHTTLYELDLPVDHKIVANDVCDLTPYRKLSSKPMRIVTECVLALHFDDDVSSVDRVCFHVRSYTCYPVDVQQL
eukprot:scaffold369_cov177-Ochromonas_danica.AAC.60